MLHRCPHCQQPGVRERDQRGASRSMPAECTLCGKYSHVVASTASAIGLLTALLGLGGLFLAAALSSWWVGVAGVGAAVVWSRWAWRRARLWPISTAAVATARICLR